MSKLVSIDYTFEGQELEVWGEHQSADPEVGIMRSYFEVSHTIPDIDDKALERLSADDKFQDYAEPSAWEDWEDYEG